MIDCFETSEDALLREPLKVMLAYVKHCCPQIELVKELRYEDVNLEDVGYVLAFNVTEDVDEPLKVLVRRAYP